MDNVTNLFSRKRINQQTMYGNFQYEKIVLIFILSIKNCLFLFFFWSSCVWSTNWLTYFIVCLLKFLFGIFRFFPLWGRKRSENFVFFAMHKYQKFNLAQVRRISVKTIPFQTIQFSISTEFSFI